MTVHMSRRYGVAVLTPALPRKGALLETGLVVGDAEDGVRLAPAPPEEDVLLAPEPKRKVRGSLLGQEYGPVFVDVSYGEKFAATHEEVFSPVPGSEPVGLSNPRNVP